MDEFIQDHPPISRRSREGAWIEITQYQGHALGYGVAPARERGLKFAMLIIKILVCLMSLPRGSVD